MTGSPDWRTRYKFQIQAVSLAVVILGSLALYIALQAGVDVLTTFCFTLIAAALLVTMWVS